MTPTFSMPDDLHRRLRIAAARCGMSMSAFVCAAVHASIETLTEHDEPLRAMLSAEVPA